MSTLSIVQTSTGVENLSTYIKALITCNDMTEKSIIEMMSRIDDYVRGRLTQEQIEELWIEFLREPYWFRIFEVEVNLGALIQEKNTDL